MDTPYSLLLLEEADPSTQDVARRAYTGRPLLVLAQRQTEGRGRGGSPWITAPRAMAASLALRPGIPVDRLPLVPLLAGVAAARVLPVGLKWPNDLMVAGRKVGGILVEAVGELVVVGMGLNLWWPGPPPGAGAIYREDPGPDSHLRVGEEWAAELLTLLETDPWPRDEYRARCVTLGHAVAWEPDGEGIALDVAPDGSLLVETEAGIVALRSGEVRHVRRVEEG